MICGVSEILKFPDDELILTQRTEEVDIRKDNQEIRTIISTLKRTIRKLKLTSLSANAIGFKKRIIGINFSDKDVKVFVNPIIVNAKGLQLSRETHYCIPNKEFIVPRNNDITIMYQTPMGVIETRQLVGLAAFVFQKELQLLDGVSLLDIGLEIDESYDNATEEERVELLNAYLDSLDLKLKDLHEEIDNDKDLKQVSDAIDFMTSVAKGETKLYSEHQNE